MISAFASLSRRERLLIGLAAVVLPAALIWQMLWKPLEAERAATAAEIARLDALIHVAAQANTTASQDSAPVDTRPPSQRINQRAGNSASRYLSCNSTMRCNGLPPCATSTG